MKEAEQLNLGPNDDVIFDAPTNLKVVVSWGTKTIHLMSRAEADVACLPNQCSLN